MYQFAKEALHVSRWVLILPAAITSWLVAFFICLELWRGMQELFCSDDQWMESMHGSCVAPWAGPALMALVAFGSALAAALVMITCELLAPTHKREVATLTFVLGGTSAILMAINLGRFAFLPMISAIVSGAIVLALLLRRCPPLSLPNTSLERPRER